MGFFNNIGIDHNKLAYEIRRKLKVNNSGIRIGVWDAPEGCVLIDIPYSMLSTNTTFELYNNDPFNFYHHALTYELDLIKLFYITKDIYEKEHDNILEQDDFKYIIVGSDYDKPYLDIYFNHNIPCTYSANYLIEHGILQQHKI